MTDGRVNQSPQEHRDISALLPWYVNDSIGEQERRHVDAHLERCAICREDLARERLVFQGVNLENPIQYIPTASLKRLQARLDGVSSADSQTALVPGKPAARGNSSRRPAWMGFMAASVAIIAVALGLLATDRWIQFRARSSAANYYTVTNGTPRAPEVVIRAVFAPTITLVELQSLLDEAQLRIVSGPSEAGVYSLAANSRLPASSSLTRLRAHAEVRFAESTQPSREAGRAGADNTP
jgi:hypothetical protein